MRRNDDPVKTNTRRETGKALILAAVFVLIICFAWMTYRWCTQRHEALPGEVILNGRMSFQRADEKLKDAGFKPMGLSRQYKDVTNQYYEGVDVCGYTTEYSYLSETKNPENRSLQIVHVFKDTESSNLDNPGEICKTVVEELTKIIGKEPEEGKDGYGTEKYLFWTLKASTEAVVLYMGDKNLMLMYVYNK
ncbi:hypothetical protein JRC49_01745 [Clostridiales bacterium FE2011]|nr:hypothetical protein JRC49_01745 [Clostridiales bacterium FE2011]